MEVTDLENGADKKKSLFQKEGEAQRSVVFNSELVRC